MGCNEKNKAIGPPTASMATPSASLSADNNNQPAVSPAPTALTDCFKLGVVFNLNQLSNLSCDLTATFPTGWSYLEDWGMWSTADAVMQIDLPTDCQGANTCELKLSLSQSGVFSASPTNPKKVFAKIDNRLIGEYSITEAQTISIPLDSQTLQNQVKDIKIQLQIPDAVSPTQFGSGDARILGIALSSYQLIKRDTN
jgi:hypothetical protein